MPSPVALPASSTARQDAAGIAAVSPRQVAVRIASKIGATCRGERWAPKELLRQG